MRSHPDGSRCTRCLLNAALSENDDVSDPGDPGLATPATLLAKRSFAGYELLSELGRGGMGAVFEARQIQPDRTVALKVIASGELATPAVVERFRIEANAAARLAHPHIVPIYEVGASDGWHFYSMQLVRGETLAEVIREEKLSRKEVALLVSKAARAVHHAHERGVLHRDLKPTNILLDESGDPQLVDFGLAKLLGSDSKATFTQAVFGTPAYMSPEQASGSHEDITISSDLYSLGVILFEALTGQLPIIGEGPVDTLRQIVEGRIPNPSTLKPGLPRDLCTICLRCLENNPSHRYATAAALADDLDCWLRDEPIKARAVTTLERVAKWMRRHPLETGLAGALALIAVGLTSLSVALNFRLDHALEESRNHAAATQRQLLAQHLQNAVEHTEESESFSAALSLSKALSLSEAESEDETSILRRLEISMQLSPRLLRLWDAGGPVKSVSLSTDDSIAVAHVTGERPSVWDLAGASQVILPDNGERQPTFTFSGGDRLVLVELYDSAPHAVFWRPGENEMTPIDDSSGPWTVGAVSPRGDRIALGGGGVRLRDMTKESWIPVEMNEAARCVALVFSPDGRYLLSCHEDGTSWLHDAHTGVPIIRLSKIDAQYAAPRFSRDGTLLLASSRTSCFLYRIPSGELIQERELGGRIFDLAISGDGTQFGVAAWHGQVKGWKTNSAQSHNLLVRHESGANRIVFSPDDRWMVTAGFDYRLQLFKNLGTWQRELILPQNGLIEAVAFGNEGQLLATGGADGVVRIWDLESSGPQRVPLRGGSTADFGGRADVLSGVDSHDRVQLWNYLRREPVGAPIPVDPGSVIQDLGPGGEWLAAAAPGGRVALINLTDGRPRHWITPKGGFSALAFDPKGSLVAVAGRDGMVDIFNIETGASVGDGLRHGEVVSRIEWSQDGRRILTQSSGMVLVWDAASLLPIGDPINAPNGFPITKARFDSSGDRMVVAFGDPYIEPSRAKVYRLPELTEVISDLSHGDGLTDAAFSPDGQRIATCGEDNSIRLWDAESGQLAVPVMKHHHIIRTMDFTPDGRILATGSADGVVKLWDVARGELAGPVLILPRRNWPVRFSPDGRHLLSVTGGEDMWLVKICDSTFDAGELRLLAELSAGSRIDEMGSFQEIPAAEQAAAFQELLNRYESVFARDR